MSRVLRVWLSLICAVQLFFAVAFFFQWSPAIALWPLEGTTPLTFILLASFFAAAAASTLWPIVTGRAGALAGVGLDYVVILTPMAATFFVLAARGEPGLAPVSYTHLPLMKAHILSMVPLDFLSSPHLPLSLIHICYG